MRGVELLFMTFSTGHWVCPFHMLLLTRVAGWYFKQNKNNRDIQLPRQPHRSFMCKALCWRDNHSKLKFFRNLDLLAFALKLHSNFPPFTCSHWTFAVFSSKSKSSACPPESLRNQKQAAEQSHHVLLRLYNWQLAVFPGTEAQNFEVLYKCKAAASHALILLLHVSRWAGVTYSRKGWNIASAHKGSSNMT